MSVPAAAASLCAQANNIQDRNSERVSSTTTEILCSAVLPVVATRAVTDIPLSGGSPDNRKPSVNSTLLYSRSTPSLEVSATSDRQPASQLPVSNVSRMNPGRTPKVGLSCIDDSQVLSHFFVTCAPPPRVTRNGVGSRILVIWKRVKECTTLHREFLRHKSRQYAQEGRTLIRWFRMVRRPPSLAVKM
ncbi:unnamed protein product [Toxocara canis]|uniref:Uncharacterized protein n=1 Tax=Toxocara canis TaxID=6265 RepID=A0A183UKX1_TOXCA|nr:unnamed protein product [Toxocara canis]